MPGPLEQRPCGETLRGCHPAHTYMQNACVYQCPGGDVLHDFPPGEVKFADVQATLDGGPGPQPGEPPTDAERIRDLKHVIQRAREALGTETPAATCDGHEARITALESALRDALAHFVHPGHPGEPCKQTGWVRVDTIDQWHAVLRGEASS